MADLANIAASATAGYKEIVLDRGSSWIASSWFEVTLEKQLTGAVAPGWRLRRALRSRR